MGVVPSTIAARRYSGIPSGASERATACRETLTDGRVRHGQDPARAAASTRSAARSPITTDGAWVCPRMIDGMTEASATRSRSTPRTVRSGAATLSGSDPIRQVPTGW